MINKKAILLFLTLVSMYSKNAAAQKSEQDTTNYASKKNQIELQPLEFAFNRIGLAYERILNSNISIRIPIQIGITQLSDYPIKNSVGAQLLFFPLQHKVVSYFAGISLKFGNYEEYTMLSPWAMFPSYQSRNFFLSEIINGIRINMGKHFCLNSSLGLGYMKKLGINNIAFSTTANFGMGIKF